MAKVDKPDTGWSAYFVELTYPAVGKYPLKVTSAVRVVPDTLPYPPFRAEALATATGECLQVRSITC